MFVLAIEGFLEGLRVELQYKNEPINLVNILPGTVFTPLFDKARVKLQKTLVKYVGIPPTYHPSIVTDAIMYAATHTSRDIIIGTGVRIVLLLQSLVPSFVDWMLRSSGFAMSRSNAPKAQADNFYTSMNKDATGKSTNEVEGNQKIATTITTLIDYNSNNK